MSDGKAFVNNHFKVSVSVELGKTEPLTFSFEYFVNSNTKFSKIVTNVRSMVAREFVSWKYEIKSISVSNIAVD